MTIIRSGPYIHDEKFGRDADLDPRYAVTIGRVKASAYRRGDELSPLNLSVSKHDDEQGFFKRAYDNGQIRYTTGRSAEYPELNYQITITIDGQTFLLKDYFMAKRPGEFVYHRNNDPLDFRRITLAAVNLETGVVRQRQLHPGRKAV